jgi:hypothetical protein
MSIKYIKTIKRVILVIAKKLPVPLVVRLADGNLSPMEIAELSSLIAQSLHEEFSEN